jgi:hypothetical protein
MLYCQYDIRGLEEDDRSDEESKVWERGRCAVDNASRISRDKK